MAGDEDTVGVGGVFGDGVSDHVADREGVTPTVVREGRGGSYIPTTT